LSIFIYFLQAEDGIRDYHVTGVQTCALPILSISMGIEFPSNVFYRFLILRFCLLIPESQYAALFIKVPSLSDNYFYWKSFWKPRSEERRVGNDLYSLSLGKFL